MKVDEISFNRSAINRNIIMMFLYVAGSEHYFSPTDIDILKLFDVSLWKEVKKKYPKATMLEIADQLLDYVEINTVI